jgi:hypothetical protein
MRGKTMQADAAAWRAAWMTCMVVALVGALFVERSARGGVVGGAADGVARRRIDELVCDAALAIRASAWHDGDLVSPTVSIVGELDGGEIVALLCAPIEPRGRLVWASLGAGRAGPAFDAAEVDLERACALLAREAVIARLGCAQAEAAMAPLPADVVADIARAIPAPPTNPAADPALLREVTRLERSGKLGASAAAAAGRLASDAARMRVRADEWRERYIAAMSTLARAADGPEGRAIVAAVIEERLAFAGWTREELRAGHSVGGSASETLAPEFGPNDAHLTRTGLLRRNPDRVLTAIRLAMLERPPCRALAELLVDLRAHRAERVDSMMVAADGRVRTGRSSAELSDARLDRWREACGLRRGARGWEGLPARPGPPPLRLRDAPGISAPPVPMPAVRGRARARAIALGYAPRDESRLDSLPAPAAAAALRRPCAAAARVRARARGRVRCVGHGCVRAARARRHWDDHDCRPRLGRALEPPAADALYRAGCAPRRSQGRGGEGPTYRGQRDRRGACIRGRPPRGQRAPLCRGVRSHRRLS